MYGQLVPPDTVAHRRHHQFGGLYRNVGRPFRKRGVYAFFGGGVIKAVLPHQDVARLVVAFFVVEYDLDERILFIKVPGMPCGADIILVLHDIRRLVAVKTFSFRALKVERHVALDQLLPIEDGFHPPESYEGVFVIRVFLDPRTLKQADDEVSRLLLLQINQPPRAPVVVPPFEIVDFLVNPVPLETRHGAKSAFFFGHVSAKPPFLGL